ncbi:MAG: hypothetical protein L6R38_002243 [Xanthoria sp. 2 TBL-2021]|nr:MAG: hypothetical protein L6R38_002243 [Xanthoria sp. 2 TBL-2021]
MVNAGKPSGACELCRKRRIKCDEAKPTCSYCLKRQLPCWFPKSQFEVAWRDQNQVASNAVQRRLNARDKASPDAERSSKEMTRPDTFNLPRVLPQDHDHYALTFLFNSYLLPSILSNHQAGFLGCVYPVWAQAAPSSPLRPAVNAVAQALLEAWSFLNPNAPHSLARSHYAQGIVAVRRQLQNAEDIDDDLLLATLLLDMYDGIRSFCGARPHEGPHVRGSAAMIENRRKLPVNSKTSQGTLLGVRSRIVGDALRKGEHVSLNVLTWTTSIQSSPRTPELDLEAINIEVANLQVSALGLKADSAGVATLGSELLNKANELDERLVAWAATLPEEWIPHCIMDSETLPRSIRDAGLYQDHCTVHKSIWTADALNIYCCSRIKIKLVTLACLEYVTQWVADSTRTNARVTLQDLADTVCASVPFYLGDRVEVRRIDDRSVEYPQPGNSATPDEHYVAAAAYGGMFLMKRLVELLKLGPHLRAGQQQWILGQMGRIKNIYLAKPA